MRSSLKDGAARPVSIEIHLVKESQREPETLLMDRYAKEIAVASEFRPISVWQKKTKSNCSRSQPVNAISIRQDHYSPCSM